MAVSRSTQPYIPIPHDLVMKNVPERYANPSVAIPAYLRQHNMLAKSANPYIFQPTQPGWGTNDWVIEFEDLVQVDRIMTRKKKPQMTGGKVEFVRGVELLSARAGADVDTSSMAATVTEKTTINTTTKAPISASTHNPAQTLTQNLPQASSQTPSNIPSQAPRMASKQTSAQVKGWPRKTTTGNANTAPITKPWPTLISKPPTADPSSPTVFQATWLTASASSNALMTRTTLEQLFRQDFGSGVLFEGPSISATSDYKILDTREDATPPLFKLSSAKMVDEAIKKYNGMGWGKFGVITLKKIAEPVPPSAIPAIVTPWSVVPAAVNASSETSGSAANDAANSLPRLHPLPLSGSTTPPATMRLGSVRWRDELRNSETFGDMLHPAKGGNTFDSVYANYVQIKNWPRTIYEYAIDFGEVGTNDLNLDGSQRMRKINKLNEKKSIVDTLGQNAPLASSPWATDYDSIWSLKNLWNHSNPGEVLPLGIVHYLKSDGREENNTPPLVTLTYARTLHLPPPTGPNSAFNLSTSHDFRERIIQALNAFVSKHANGLASSRNVVQVGPNKFFARRVFKELDPSRKNLLAYRGFSTSVRPTANLLLLGIAPLTSAFYRPVTVQDWILLLTQHGTGFTQYEEILRTTIGLRCRLRYDRPQPEKDGPDPNHERNRYKVVTEFGRSLQGNNRQQYQPRTPPNSSLLTVQSFFQDLISSNPKEFSQDIICVNVGAKLKWDSKLGMKEPNLDSRDPHNHNPIRRIHNPSNYENFSKAIWIPANLLEIEPVQLYSKLLKPAHTSSMIKVACNHPALNRAWIEKKGFDFLGITNIDSSSSWMKSLSLDIDSKLIRVPMTFKIAPTVHYGNKILAGKIGGTDPIDKASWNLVDTRFAEPCRVHNLCIITVTAGNQHGLDTRSLIRGFEKQFNIHGIGMTSSTIETMELSITDDSNEQDVVTRADVYFQSIGTHIHGSKALKNRGKKLNLAKDTLFIIVLPNKDPSHLFQAVKRAADYNGLKSICVLREKVDGNCSAQYISNLCLKVSAKAGAAVHHVNRLQALKDTIVLGADIGTVKGAPAGCPAVASVVGSINSSHMNMPGSMRLIPARKDIIPAEAMKEMVKERLLAWGRYNGSKLPQNILMYRDGISQSQYAYLLERSDGSFLDKPTATDNSFKTISSKNKKKHTPQDGEVVAIRDAYREAAAVLNNKAAPCPKITFVVVGKRHNTRFFPTCADQQWYNGNLWPGALIESGCTLPNEWPVVDNFFLQSHQVIQGTGRAAHYVVLQDDMGLTKLKKAPNGLSYRDLHDVTHAFCFAYTRATRGVSYAAPAYHADRLCSRGQDYLKRIMMRLKDESWWGTMPPASQENPFPADAWYDQIATYLGLHPDWMGNDATTNDPHRRNPWHRDLDGGMFWL